jgi:hypothetical protein
MTPRHPAAPLLAPLAVLLVALAATAPTAAGAQAAGSPASGAIAQAAQAPAEVEPGGTPAQTPPTTGEKQQPAAAAAEPAAAPPAADPVIRIYGILNPRLFFSSAAEESFSQATAVAITAAGNPAYATQPDNARFSLQVQQSRFGIWVNEKGAFRGQLEFDFVDFAKATPTVQEVPRVRIARADWVAGPHTLQLGQDWDLNAPINPHGINLVGALFQAGNTGFMRQQLRYLYSADAFELGAALGFPGVNAGLKDAALELNLTPSLAGRAAYKLGKGRAGASFIVSQLPYGSGDALRRSLSYQGVLFADVAPSADTNVRAEAYYGQNVANLGALALGQGNATTDYQEVGAFVSVRQTVAAGHAFFGMAGRAQVLNAADVVPSYAYPVPATPTLGTAVLAAGVGPGIRNNTAARLGYEFRPAPALALVLEGFYYGTEHVLRPEDVTRGLAGRRDAFGLETGMLFTF